MKNDQFSSTETIKSALNDASRYLLNHENRVRRLVEMQRRVRLLQVKRNHLRNELKAVEKYLVSLDHQIKSHESYEQLTFK